MNEPNEGIKRRDFIFKAGVFSALGLGILTFFRNLFLYIFPPRRPKSYHRYLVAKQEELAVGKAKKIYLGRTPVYIVRLKDEFKVFSGVCTHLGCIIKWEQDKHRFFCPCHQGVFDETGKVVSGPPPKPLDEFKVEVERNLVYVYVQDKVRSPWA